MFLLVKIKDVVRIAPTNFALPRTVSIAAEINRLYSNKVLHNVGLVIKLFDILEAGDANIFHSDGASQCDVVFRIVVFRPFIGEVMVGRVTRSTEAGIWISMDFFDSIHVPKDCLPNPSYFDSQEQAHYWDWEGTKLMIYQNERVRFRITEEKFEEVSMIDMAAVNPAALPSMSAAPPDYKSLPTQPESLADEEATHQHPYSLTATMDDNGLGNLNWWEQDL